MKYSVYDYDRKVYDYYEGPSLPIPPTGGFRQTSKTLGKVGFSPEDFAAILPAGSRKTGSGADPLGAIATKRFSFSTIGKNNFKILSLGALIGLGAGWFYWKRRK
ncbi:hypothetical protein DRH13_00890 [Candidatus Woesebacteria bacterium]|nr:MAG: hypothetical protein DRH13_00890 [Candidatus Woesebacteria bacterium]